MKGLRVIVFMCSLLLLGCSGYHITALPQDSLQREFDSGVEIFTSQTSQSLVRFEVAQHLIGGNNNIPLAIFIVAQMKKGDEVMFDMDCIWALQNGKQVEILDYEAAKQSNLNFGKAIESFGIFTPKEQTSSQSVLIPSPILIYRGHPGFFLYTPWVYSARDRLEQSERLEEKRRERSVILSSYLRKNTLKVGNPPRGGFIVIDPSELQSGVLELYVRVGTQIHTLKLMLEK